MSTLEVSNITGVAAFTSSTNTATFGNSVYFVANGNVGVGAVNPATKLEVSGVGLFRTGTNDFIQILSDSGAIEITRAAGEAYIDFKNSAAEDFDVRLQSIGTNGTFSVSTAAGERMRVTDTGLFQFNSGYGSVATAFGCRAWVNFNGTGVVAIRASGNITSITDNNTGDYTANFTTAMPDTNYCVAGSANRPGFSLACVFGENVNRTKTTSAAPVVTANDAGTLTDPSSVNVVIYR